VSAPRLGSSVPVSRGAWVAGPRIRRDRDKDAVKIRQLRDDGQSYAEIADKLGHSKSDIARVCATLNCSSATGAPVMLV